MQQAKVKETNKRSYIYTPCLEFTFTDKTYRSCWEDSEEFGANHAIDHFP